MKFTLLDLKDQKKLLKIAKHIEIASLNLDEFLDDYCGGLEKELLILSDKLTALVNSTVQWKTLKGKDLNDLIHIIKEENFK